MSTKDKKSLVRDDGWWLCKIHKTYHHPSHVKCQRKNPDKPGYVYEDELPGNWQWDGEEI